jgi:hypothetical protein
MSDLEAMDREIDELAVKIGLSVARLQQLLQKDDRYIDQLIALGKSREFAEKASFIGDLRNVLGLMASHNFSAHTAARMIGQTPENPVEISTTEDEEDEDEQPRTPSSQDDASVYPDSSGSSYEDPQSVTSSEDEPTVKAKRLKKDPDYQPSSDEDSELAEEEEEESQ